MKRARRIILFLSIGFAVALLAALSLRAGLFIGLERAAEDLLSLRKPIDSRLTIIAIDDESIARIGQWPWPREVFARAFRAIERSGASAVGLDVIFREASRLGATDDGALAEVLGSISIPVVLPVEGVDGALRPLEIFSGPNISLGHVNIIADPDHVVRTVPRNAGSLSSFAEQLVVASGGSVRGAVLDIERIVYSAPAGSVRRIPFWRLLEGDAPDMGGKIVLIGVTASDLHDEQATPFSRGVKMPGVEIQANIINMLLKGYRLRDARGISMAWVAVLSVLTALGFALLSGVVASWGFALGCLVLALILPAILFSGGTIITIVHGFLAVCVSAIASFAYRHYVAEREKSAIKSVFSKYVSPKVLDEILKDPSHVTLGGEEREVTLLFSDIRGFTTLSEQTTPQNLVRMLNDYFTAMTNEILSHDGVLDKYIGDAIMAFWGAPIGDSHQADKAVKAALGMIEKLKEVNARFKAAGDPEIKIGIGIYTGPAVVGNVGSNLRFDYTAIGDTVNAASRLEGANKEFKTTLLVGEATVKKTTVSFPFEPLGAVSVKGRAEPITIYTIRT